MDAMSLGKDYVSSEIIKTIDLIKSIKNKDLMYHRITSFQDVNRRETNEVLGNSIKKYMFKEDGTVIKKRLYNPSTTTFILVELVNKNNIKKIYYFDTTLFFKKMGLTLQDVSEEIVHLESLLSMISQRII
jgi:hypothetical protein